MLSTGRAKSTQPATSKNKKKRLCVRAKDVVTRVRSPPQGANFQSRVQSTRLQDVRTTFGRFLIYYNSISGGQVLVRRVPCDTVGRAQNPIESSVLDKHPDSWSLGPPRPRRMLGLALSAPMPPRNPGGRYPLPQKNAPA